MTYSIRPLQSDGFAAAYELAWNTFTVSLSEHYTAEGRESFHSFLYSGDIEDMYMTGNFVMYGCFSEDDLIGVGGLMKNCHISLLFVAPEYQRRGIGRLLAEKMISAAAAAGCDSVTLNAAPDAVGFYKAIGFEETDMERISDGILYIPMKYPLQKKHGLFGFLRSFGQCSGTD
ncbi:MAG: GNAT family N-acetyltransferase [Oscillospiraceae bacterium]|nr:GNAT family N-acetyltransferase [Oscillospiraceae bacterium]